MRHELSEHEVEELIGAYAIDAVEDWERDQIERSLLVNPRLRAELDAHREAISHVAGGSLSPDQPPGLWERIEAELNAEPPPLALVPVTRLEDRRPRWARYVTGVAAAAAVIVAVVLGVQVVQQDERIDDLNAALSQNAVERAAAAAVTAPGSEVVTLAAPEGTDGFGAQIVLGADGVGYLLSDDMPALGADRTYQLWAIVGERVISAGVLGQDPGVSPFQVAGGVTGFAITEEMAGGVVSSENPALSLWVRS